MRILVYTGPASGGTHTSIELPGLHSLEFALQIQDLSGAEVHVLSTEQAHLREAIMIGARRGFLLNTDLTPGAYEALFTELGTSDLLVGFPDEAAAILNLPLIRQASQPLEAHASYLTVQVEERRRTLKLRAPLPAAIIVAPGANTPRLPSYRRQKEMSATDIVKLDLAQTEKSVNAVSEASDDPRIEILETIRKEYEVDIRDAEILVAVGRGIGTPENLPIIEELADLLGAEMGCTRPLTELGWFAKDRQIGISGHKVSPKVLITIGVSGAIQFELGIKGAETVIAINSDENAPIFKIAEHKHVDSWEVIVPEMIKTLQDGGQIHGLSRT